MPTLFHHDLPYFQSHEVENRSHRNKLVRPGQVFAPQSKRSAGKTRYKSEMGPKFGTVENHQLFFLLLFSPKEGKTDARWRSFTLDEEEEEEEKPRRRNVTESRLSANERQWSWPRTNKRRHCTRCARLCVSANQAYACASRVYKSSINKHEREIGNNWREQRLFLPCRSTNVQDFSRFLFFLSINGTTFEVNLGDCPA